MIIWPGRWSTIPLVQSFWRRCGTGDNPRALWQVTPSATPSGDWTLGLASAARACADSGRGAVIVVPDQTDLDRLSEACTQLLGAAGFAVLVAEAGPAARYRAFLSALRGEVRVVIGNRAAAYAPVHDLGLVALWDDGDDLLSEQRAPYPHTREVLALRAAEASAGVLFASYARTAELQSWTERGWLREISADRVSVRHAAPRVRVTADSDLALERDPSARAARLPHEVFDMMRATLPQGPVLVQVPRAGYLVALVCQECREPMRCGFCGGPTRAQAGDSPEVATVRASCEWCGRPQIDWECPICSSRRVRAPIVGAERTAEELGKAFPQTPVRKSIGGKRLAEVNDSSAIVVATPGAEPPAEGGYAGAVLLDTTLLLLRQDLRAAEEALRRWLNVVALVRSWIGRWVRGCGGGKLGPRPAGSGASRSGRFRHARAQRTSSHTVSTRGHADHCRGPSRGAGGVCLAGPAGLPRRVAWSRGYGPAAPASRKLGTPHSAPHAARSTGCRLTTGPRREGGGRDPQRPKKQRSPPDQGESSHSQLTSYLSETLSYQHGSE